MSTNMRDPQEQINAHVRDGHDVVFAERHTVTADTFRHMSQAIADTNTVDAVSLEYPPEIQSVLDDAVAGGIDKATFIKELALSQTGAIWRAAQNMLAANSITQEQCTQAQAVIDERINIIIDTDFLGDDSSAYAALYDLARTAASREVTILANDQDLDFAVLKLLASRLPDVRVNLNDFVQRLNDRTDFELLTSQVDFNTAGSILVHRGANHTHDIEGHPTGMDDFLVRQGRSVSVIGHYRCFNGLAEAFNSLQSMGVSVINDPTDHTIVDGRWYQGVSDLTLFKGLMQARQNWGAGAIIT